MSAAASCYPSVPATRRALTDFPPRRLYLDTSFVLNSLITTHPYHAQAVDFLVNLVTSGVTTLYVSALSWMEFAHAVCLPAFRNSLPAGFQQRFQLHDWEQ